MGILNFPCIFIQRLLPSYHFMITTILKMERMRYSGKIQCDDMCKVSSTLLFHNGTNAILFRFTDILHENTNAHLTIMLQARWDAWCHVPGKMDNNNYTKLSFLLMLWQNVGFYNHVANILVAFHICAYATNRNIFSCVCIYMCETLKVYLPQPHLWKREELSCDLERKYSDMKIFCIICTWQSIWGYH